MNEVYTSFQFLTNLLLKSLIWSCSIFLVSVIFHIPLLTTILIITLFVLIFGCWLWSLECFNWDRFSGSFDTLGVVQVCELPHFFFNVRLASEAVT